MLRKRPLGKRRLPVQSGDKKMNFPLEKYITIMAVYYKVYQNNNPHNPNKGNWYARAAMIDTDTTETLAKSIMEKCTVNEADVLAVIKALVGEITRSLQSSHRVKLPGFGTFKIGITSSGAPSRDKFSVANITGAHVLFQPELKISANGTRTRTFLTGTRVKELINYEGLADDADSGKSDAGDKPATDDSGKSDAGDSGKGTSPQEGV